MIKLMASENMRVARIDDNTIVLSIYNNDTQLTVDEFQELYRVTQQFWDANSLWQFTKEAIEERERYPVEMSHKLSASI